MNIKEFKNLHYDNFYWNESSAEDLAIKFAKYHVKLALKNAVEKIEMDVEYDTDRIAYPILEEESILNSYSLDNIK